MDARLAENSSLQLLIDQVRAGARINSLSGLTTTSAKAMVLHSLQAETKKAFAVVAASNEELDTWECDLQFWNSTATDKNKASIVSLPSFESDVYAGTSPHAETQERRALALWQLASSQSDLLIVSAKSLITRVYSPESICALGAILKIDEDFAPDELIELLSSVGYVREEPILNVGQFSSRGGIIDVWPPDAENPVRIEFFGDTVDSIREFDADTQL